MTATRLGYLRDPDAIYRASFAAIRAATPVAHLPAELQPLALRLVHACGMPEIVTELVHGGALVAAAQTALAAGAPLLVDAQMVAAGIQKARLPAGNPVLCTLDEPATADLAARAGTTRSAAAVELWGDRLAGAVVAIGNAPTALFRLLELLADGAPEPAAILAFPVGFIGAAEAKEALIAAGAPPPFVTLRGRRGGSAMAAAAVNALLGAPGR
jgi:precorrin-8X/cobalt-precorrin-8 methylmutase